MGANMLEGPAFPPAWIRRDALPQLQVLDLNSNAGLTGALPNDLSWPALVKL